MAAGVAVDAGLRRTYVRAIASRLASPPAPGDKAGALAVARSAARVLREEFGARRVLLFGSLAGGLFTRFSDIDLAAEGIDPGHYYAAVARAEHAAGAYRIDVVDLGACADSLRGRILASGMEL
jgi:predicted nucleotidyltransferase